MKKIVLFLIDIYQKHFSPDHSSWGKRRYPHGYCRYYPSCSEYSKQAFQKYGMIKALLKSIWRVLRCNSFSQGGVDIP